MQKDPIKTSMYALLYKFDIRLVVWEDQLFDFVSSFLCIEVKGVGVSLPKAVEGHIDGVKVSLTAVRSLHTPPGGQDCL